MAEWSEMLQGLKDRLADPNLSPEQFAALKERYELLKHMQ